MSIEHMFQWIQTLVFEKVSTLAEKYPDKALKVLWFYNYFTVLIGNFMERHKIFTKKTALLQMPIEKTYFARFYCYDVDSIKNLFFETSQQYLLVMQPGQIILYKTPEYTLCGCFINDSIEAPKKSSAKFINVTFSNESMNEPVTIKLDASYFHVGNEILSAAHTLFLLKTAHEPSTYMFDDNYKIRIVDNGFNMVELQSYEWIKFDDSAKGYIKKGTKVPKGTHTKTNILD